MNKQKGVVEIAVIIVLAITAITYLRTDHMARESKDQHQQQQINILKSDGANDGRVDW